MQDFAKCQSLSEFSWNLTLQFSHRARLNELQLAQWNLLQFVNSRETARTRVWIYCWHKMLHIYLRNPRKSRPPMLFFAFVQLSWNMTNSSTCPRCVSNHCYGASKMSQKNKVPNMDKCQHDYVIQQKITQFWIRMV